MQVGASGRCEVNTCFGRTRPSSVLNVQTRNVQKLCKMCPNPFVPPPPDNLEYLLAVCENLAHPFHPVYDDGKGGGWKWWE